MNRRDRKQVVRGLAAWVSLSARVGWAIFGEAWDSAAKAARRFILKNRASLRPQT